MERMSIWEEETQVRSYDTDSTGRLKMVSLFNYFQEAAGNQAANLGIGYDVLQGAGLLWVLSRVKVKIEHLPNWGDRVTLQTWPKGHEGPLFLRDFLLRDEKKETLVAGTSGWLLLDQAHYRPHLADALPVEFKEFVTRHALEEPLKKIRPQEALVPVYERKVLLNDLDVNNHVNNARYVEWIMDCYEPADILAKTVRSLQVNYVGEVSSGDAVKLLRSDSEAVGGVHYIEGVHSTKGTKVMQALIEWRQNI